MQSFQVFQVGGSVRDALLGQVSRDRDYVVVGAVAEDLLRLGYEQVGADFPVFLHPETKDEYALARVERKLTAGYHGFAVSTKDVTLEEDLSRRDLTINAMALRDDGSLVDPYGGAKDLASKTLRHVSPAFQEDPVRVLRIARFLARFGPEWSVADSTKSLCQQMVRNGEMNALTPERVWKEVEKGLMEPHPHLMLNLLTELGVLSLSSFKEYWGMAAHDQAWLKKAADAKASLGARLAIALPRMWSSDEAKRTRIPSELRQVCQYLHEALADDIWDWKVWPLAQRAQFLVKVGALKQGSSFAALCEALDARMPTLGSQLAVGRQVLLGIDQRAVLAGVQGPAAIQQALLEARVAALATALSAD